MRFRSLISPCLSFSFFVVTVSVFFFFLTIKLADKWLLLVGIRVALNPPILAYISTVDAMVADEVKVRRGFPTHLGASFKWLRKNSK